MTKKQRALDEVEKTLQSFDDDPVLEANPFLTTRIQAEMNRRRQMRPAGFRLHVSLSQALVLCVLLINIITVAHYLSWSKNQMLHDRLVSALKEDAQIVQSQDPF
jgi:hypothetical protein